MKNTLKFRKIKDMNKVITIDFKQKLQKINLKEIKKVKEIKSKRN